jgi:hypothetical protein
MLIEKPEELVTREELSSRLWSQNYDVEKKRAAGLFAAREPEARHAPIVGALSKTGRRDLWNKTRPLLISSTERKFDRST